MSEKEVKFIPDEVGNTVEFTRRSFLLRSLEGAGCIVAGVGIGRAAKFIEEDSGRRLEEAYRKLGNLTSPDSATPNAATVNRDAVVQAGIERKIELGLAENWGARVLRAIENASYIYGTYELLSTTEPRNIK